MSFERKTVKCVSFLSDGSSQSHAQVAAQNMPFQQSFIVLFVKPGHSCCRTAKTFVQNSG